MSLIECPECKKQISDKAVSCPNCGYPLNKQQTDNADENEYLCCPKCHSKELHSEHQGFSGGKALAGAVLTGGIGILAGTIGSKDVRITCLKCGHHFKAGEALVEKGYTAKNRMEAQIVEFLKQDKLVNALELYRKETHQELKPSMDYIHDIARKYNIEIKQNKGCSVLLSVCIVVLSTVGYLIFFI
jgi:hypothetical protein